MSSGHAMIIIAMLVKISSTSFFDNFPLFFFTFSLICVLYVIIISTLHVKD